VASQGYITGTGPDTFEPNGAVTRAQVAILIARAIGRANDKYEGESSISDVPSEAWYFNQVMTLIDLQILTTELEVQKSASIPMTRLPRAAVLQWLVNVKHKYQSGLMYEATALGLLRLLL
jgi:hypothetical protein